MWVELHDAAASDPSHPEVIINTDTIAQIWQHPTLGCLIEFLNSNQQNVNTTETYAQVTGLLGTISRVS